MKQPSLMRGVKARFHALREDSGDQCVQKKVSLELGHAFGCSSYL